MLLLVLLAPFMLELEDGHRVFSLTRVPTEGGWVHGASCGKCL